MRSSNPRHAVSRHGSAVPRSESLNAGEAVCDPAPMCRGTEAAALGGSDLWLTHLHTSPLPSGELSLSALYSAATTSSQTHLLRFKIARRVRPPLPLPPLHRLGMDISENAQGSCTKFNPPLAIDKLLKKKNRILNKYSHLVARS